MANQSNDDGVLLALLERFEHQRLPRILRLKQKVYAGEKLDDVDIALLEQVLQEAGQVKPLVDKHPEYHALVSKAIHLYHDITVTALKNEQGT